MNVTDSDLQRAYDNLGDATLHVAKRIGLPGTISEAVEKWYSAHITNGYLFFLVMKDTSLCTKLLRVLLPEIKGLKVIVVEAQRVLESGLIFRYLEGVEEGREE